MYGAYLYRLNFEEYQKRELEIDEKIKRLSVESEDEDDEYEALDGAYILRVNKKLPLVDMEDDMEDDEEDDEEDDFMLEPGCFVLFIGDSHYDNQYADEVIFGLDSRYEKYKEWDGMEISKLDDESKDEWYKLSDSVFHVYFEEAGRVADEIVFNKEKSQYGDVIKKIF